MAFFLGIDGGGSGCRAAVADADGRIVGQGRGGPANINTDAEGAAVSILAATAEALEGTGADPRDLIATLGKDSAVFTNVAQAVEEIAARGFTLPSPVTVRAATAGPQVAGAGMAADRRGICAGAGASAPRPRCSVALCRSFPYSG